MCLIMAVWKYKIAELPSVLTGNYHPITEALLTARGYTDVSARECFLFPQFDRDLHDPFLFSHMERVVERIGLAKTKNELIGVFGDFDADGITSSVIIREALTMLDITTVVYIPEKLSEGCE